MVRHADPARDAAACAAIYAPYVRDSAVSFEDDPPSPIEIERRIARVSDSFPWLVAERDGQVIGFAYASQHHGRDAYRWAAEASIYVDASHHRRGVGRALYEALFALLRRQRIHVVCAGITLPNEASVGLHESLGFEPIGVYRAIGYKAGAWRDVGWWQLTLIEPEAQPAEPLLPQR